MRTTKDNIIDVITRHLAGAPSSRADRTVPSHRSPITTIDILLCDEALLSVPVGSIVKAARACGADAPLLMLVDNTSFRSIDDIRSARGMEPDVLLARIDDADFDDELRTCDSVITHGATPELWLDPSSNEAFAWMAPRVLVADDDPDLRALIAQAFIDMGFDVIEAADGDTAVAIARHVIENRPDGAALDLVVSDLCMPGRDGVSVVEALDELDDEVPVILMSADGGEHLQRCERSGAHAVLSKPFDLDDLCALARDVVSWRHA